MPKNVLICRSRSAERKPKKYFLIGLNRGGNVQLDDDFAVVEFWIDRLHMEFPDTGHDCRIAQIYRACAAINAENPAVDILGALIDFLNIHSYLSFSSSEF